VGKTAIKWLVSLSALIAVTAFYQAGNTKARAANRFVMTTLAKGRFGETKVFSRFIPQNGWRLFVRVASVVGDMKSGLSRKWSRDNTIVIYTHKVYGVLVGHIRGEVRLPLRGTSKNCLPVANSFKSIWPVRLPEEVKVSWPT